MEHEILISADADKKEKYEQLLPQIYSLTEDEPDFIANLANIIAALKTTFQFFWIGSYFVKDNDLVLGPFQGPLACTRIAFGKGVCGKSLEEKQVVLVEDVNEFNGHIACNSNSKSEIVLPVFDAKKEVFMVLDIDSDRISEFDATDKLYLEKITRHIGEIYQK